MLFEHTNFSCLKVCVWVRNLGFWTFGAEQGPRVPQRDLTRRAMPMGPTLVPVCEKRAPFERRSQANRFRTHVRAVPKTVGGGAGASSSPTRHVESVLFVFCGKTRVSGLVGRRCSTEWGSVACSPRSTCLAPLCRDRTWAMPSSASGTWSTPVSATASAMADRWAVLARTRYARSCVCLQGIAHKDLALWHPHCEGRPRPARSL